MQSEMLRNVSQTTVNIHLRNIRTVINKIINSSPDNSLMQYYPFRAFRFRKDCVPRERALDIDVLRKIINYPHSTLRRVNMAHDVFCMSFCLCGMNAIDMYYAEDYDGERITYYAIRHAHAKAKEPKYPYS